MHFFDSHTHLESPEFEPDRDQVLARARAEGVTRMVTCGSDLATSSAAVALAGRFQGVYAAVGIHPHEARSVVQGGQTQRGRWELDEAALEQLSELAAHPKVVAIGEAGLDYHYEFSAPEAQRAVLARQLALACELDLPIILHNRESDQDLCALVDGASACPRGVLHCFLADLPMARWGLAKGFYIGIAGPITFKSASHLLEIVREIPIDRLLIETDAPQLAPHPMRGRRNEPAFVVHVAERLSEVLGLSLEEVAHRTTENACHLFGLPAPSGARSSSSPAVSETLTPGDLRELTCHGG